MPVAALALAAALAGVLVATVPIQVAMVSVLAFAGPHNLLELRYLLGRLPSRLTVFSRYFVVAGAGIAILAGSSIAMSWLGQDGGLPPAVGPLWHTALIGWIASLALLKRLERPGRSVDLILPISLAAASLAWWAPARFGMAIVFAHPLLALWFLDRELRGRHRRFRPAFHRALLVIPAAVALIWWVVPAPAAAESPVRDLMVRQTGAWLFGSAASDRLLATHAFLELLHYGVWIGLIPALAIRGPLLNPGGVPVARRGPARRTVAVVAVGVAAAVTVALWIGFGLDYVATRELYFTVAIVHVLAEVPALIRLG